MIKCIEQEIVPAVWKEDKNLGIAFFCSNCKRFVCSSGSCDCGKYVDINLPKRKYNGPVKWLNYTSKSKL